MAVKCDFHGDRSTYLSFYSARYLGAARSRQLTYKIDDLPPVEVTLAAYDDHAAWIPNRDDPYSAIAAMRTGKIVKVQLFDFKYNPIFLQFSLNDFRSKLASFAAECKDQRLLDTLATN